MNNILYFEHSNGKRTVVGKPNTKREIHKMINDFIHMINPYFKSYYTQITLGENEICFDIGSHTEFFYIDTEAFNNMDEE